MRRYLMTAAALATPSLVLGSVAPSPAAEVGSGIRGHVVYGPTCPVQRIGQICLRPYQATIVVRREPGNRVISTVRSSARGYFQLRLRPGRYLLAPRSGHPFPRAAPVAATVHSHRFTSVTISYDSGIR